MGSSVAAVAVLSSPVALLAQFTQVASAAPVAATSSSTSDVDSPAAQTDAASPTIAATPAVRRGWGFDYRQEQTPGKGYLHTHGFDLAGSGTGRYQTSVTHQAPAVAGTTEGVGFLANIREHPTSWFGLELNYGYNKYTEHYGPAASGVTTNRVQIGQHEATAGYVFHIRTPYVQPFVVLGGGGVNFRSIGANGQGAPFSNQWRGAAMYEVGLDFVSKRQPHVGFRLQEHGLFYKAPDFYVASFRSNGWVHQALPSAGVFYRF